MTTSVSAAPSVEQNGHMLAVGWREMVTLPQFSDRSLTAKVDTGAKTSSLHAPDLVVDEDGPVPVATFTLYGDRPARRNISSGKNGLENRADVAEQLATVQAPIIGFRDVRSSNGEAEKRPVIGATLELGGTPLAVEFTLTDRTKMRFRILLGRRFLAERYYVDSGRSFVFGKVESGEENSNRSRNGTPG